MFLSRTFRLLLRPLAVLLFSAPVIALLLAVQTQPGVPAGEPLTATEIFRLEQLLLESAPQEPAARSLQYLRLNARELNSLVRHGLDMAKLSSQWAARVTLGQDTVEATLSRQVLAGTFPQFLNIYSESSVRNNSLRLERLRIGNLQIPRPILQFALDRISRNLHDANPVFQDFGGLTANIRRLDVSPEGMQLELQWDPVLLGRLSDGARRFFISDTDRIRIARHYQVISDVATTVPADLDSVSLNTFLVPLFAAAHERSLQGSDAIAENRTLLQTLDIYVNNEDIALLLGEDMAADIQPARQIEIRLQHRVDMAQHLAAIAAITVSAGADVAQLMSTTKEVYDARYHTGFSFSDLTANTVGISLASLSIRDQEAALLIQERLSLVQAEADYMPAVESVYDNLSESDFNVVYSDRNSPQYQNRLAEIEMQIRTRSLFQGLL